MSEPKSGDDVQPTGPGTRAVVAALLALAGYALIGLTGVYGPLFEGRRDDSWVMLLGLAGIFFAAGALIRKPWALSLALLTGLLALDGATEDGGLADDSGAAGFVILTAVSIASAIPIGLGLLVGRASMRTRHAAVVVAGVMALVPVTWGGLEQLRRGEPLPDQVRGQIEGAGNIVILCRAEREGRKGDRTKRIVREERRFDLLVRELNRDPQQTLTRTFPLAHASGTSTETWTVSEMAELVRHGFAQKGPCPDAQSRLDAALG